MSDEVFKTLITVIGSFLTATLVPFGLWLAYIIRKLEKNTNHIHEEVVKLTGDKAYSEGRHDEKVDNPTPENRK